MTDLNENSKVTLPKPCDPYTESGIELLKSNIMKSFKKYQSKYCTGDGEQKSNLTNEELRGMRKLKKRVKDGEILILKTDKSGKFFSS